MPKTKTKDKKLKTSNAWFELQGEKEEFKKMVHILNRYYNLNKPINHPSPAHMFREDIVRAELDRLRIFMKKFGSFEFLIVVEISSDSGKRMDSWIHIDGISQERIIMTEKGNLEHPVFKIMSMNDLFQQHTKEVEKGFQPKVDDIVDSGLQPTV